MKKFCKRNDSRNIRESFLKNVGLTDIQEANDWFRKSRADGYYVAGMKEAAELASTYTGENDLVVVFGDFDTDGEMSMAIMDLVFKIKDINVQVMAPQRHFEGYGANMRMFSEVQAANPGKRILLILVDNGIVCYEVCHAAKEAGWQVVIMDHHLGQYDEAGNIILPECDIAIDPEAMPGTSDFDGYCAAGLCWKFASAMLGQEQARIFMPMAAIATIADVVPLREENYVIVRDGLMYLNKGYAPMGVTALARANNATFVDETTIGFTMAPCCNAPARLYPTGWEKVVDLMTCTDKFSVMNRASLLVEDNKARKEQEAFAVAKVTEALPAGAVPDIVISYIPGVNPGLVGVMAGKIAEKEQRPVVLLTDSWKEKGALTGSSRATGNLNIKEALDAVKTTLQEYGGHAKAAGLTLRSEAYDEFTKGLLAYAAGLNLSFDPSELFLYDQEITAGDISETVAETVKYGPFGEGNPKLVFKVTGFVPSRDAYTGKFKREIGGGGVKFRMGQVEAVGFGMAEKMADVKGDKPLTFYGTLSYNRFQGRTTPQIEFVEFEEEDVPEVPKPKTVTKTVKIVK